MPAVSVITPIYNGMKNFEETVQSVLAQDFDDYEWILFDDGSSDGSQARAKELSSDFPGKIFYHEHEGNKNKGTAYTRNRAVEKSRSELIAFLDQDDVWEANRLSYHLKLFSPMSDTAMIWSPVLYWYSERSFVQPAEYKGKKFDKVFEPPDFVEVMLSDLRVAPLPSATIVRKEFFNKVKGYEESIRGAEDIVMLVKIAGRFRIYFDDKVLVKHRKHQDSTLRQAAQSGIMNEWNLVFFKWVIDYLKENRSGSSLIRDYEFAYYNCLKKISGKKNYLQSRKELLKGLRNYPELREKYSKDFLLDLILPFRIASKVSAKLRFDLFDKSRR